MLEVDSLHYAFNGNTRIFFCHPRQEIPTIPSVTRLPHYTQDFEMVSPYIVQIAEQASGKLRGKAAVGAYWSKALDKMPHLHFDLINVLVGIDSVVINYHGARGLACEVLYFDDAGLVVRAYAHYA